MARRRGIEAVTTAMDTGEPVVALVRIGDIARAGLTPNEFAAMFGQPVSLIYREIKEGRIPVLSNSRERVIPVSYIPEYQRRAQPLDPTA